MTSLGGPFDDGLSATRRRIQSVRNPDNATRPNQMDGMAGRATTWRRNGNAFGELDKPGPYVVLMKWYPGYMSAPHSYASDRLCLVLSGTWWVRDRPHRPARL
jgi:hypothetical protein